MTTIEILLLIMCIVLAVAAGFFISTLIEVRRTAAQATQSLKTTGESLDSALKELEETSRSVRCITDDINSVTRHARELSDSFAEVAEDAKEILHSVHGLTSRTSAKYLALKVGIRTAFEVLLDNLFSKGGRQ